jgi:hypothetical protein
MHQATHLDEVLLLWLFVVAEGQNPQEQLQAWQTT